MSEGAIPFKKAVPIIVVTWILSLVSTLALVYVAPSIFPPLQTANINDGAVVSDKIADGAIITVKLADGTVTSAKILDGTITAADITDGSVLNVKIGDGAVTATKIADGAISSAKVADDAIVTIKLADGAVTSAKISDGTIIASDLASGAITEIKIVDGAVTASKISDYAVTNLKLAGEAIPFNSTYALPGASTTSTSFVDMPAMSVNIQLARTSHLVIMLSSEFWISVASGNIVIRALINSTVAYPPITYVTSGAPMANMGSYSYVFYRPSVSAGFYTVKVQWMMDGLAGSEGNIGYRTLSVIALPA